MKALHELMDLVTRYKRRQIEILSYNEDADNRYELFYDRLEKDKFADDDEAAAFFFGPDKTGRFTQYQNLKAAFFKRLVNTLFFLDLKKPEFNEAQTAHYNCWKYLAAMRMLIARSAKHASFQVATKLLKPAMKYEETEVTLEVARKLLSHYTTYKPDQKKQKEYRALVEKSLADLNTLVRAETMYHQLIAPYITSRSSKPWVAEMAKKFIERLESQVNEESPFKVWMYYFIIKKIEREAIYDYGGMAEVCREALAHFEGKDSSPRSVFTIFLNTLLVSLTMTGQFEEGEKVAAEASTKAEKGAPNWFKNRELYLVMQFYKKDYQRAYEVYRESLHQAKFKYLPDMEKESWKIYKGYLTLVILSGKISLDKKEAKAWAGRPAKLLNEVPTYAKDKQGMNIPRLIVHAIMLLYLQRYDEAYDRMLALEKYGSRHLKAGDDTYRSWCFFQALLQIPKAGFQRKKSETLAADWLHEMRAQPVMLTKQPHEVEAIPYDHLWDTALEALEKSGDRNPFPS